MGRSGVIILLVIVLLAVGAYFVLRKGSTDSDGATSPAATDTAAPAALPAATPAATSTPATAPSP